MDLKTAIKAVLDHYLSGIDYLAHYPARVVSQNGAGLLEVIPDDTRLPSLTGVPIRIGIPGVSVKVSSGLRVMIGFENGDPSRPVAELWDGSSGDALEIDMPATTKITLADGVLGVARMTDPVVAGPFAGTITVGSTKVFSG